MTKAVFQLEPLTCPSCIKKIESALKRTAGMVEAKVLFNSGKVKTEFDEELINADQLEHMIEKLGYMVINKKVAS